MALGLNLEIPAKKPKPKQTHLFLTDGSPANSAGCKTAQDLCLRPRFNATVNPTWELLLPDQKLRGYSKQSADPT